MTSRRRQLACIAKSTWDALGIVLTLLTLAGFVISPFSSPIAVELGWSGLHPAYVLVATVLLLVFLVVRSARRARENLEEQTKSDITEIDGKINVETVDTATTEGVVVEPDSGMVRFTPGTEINVRSQGGRSTTGVRIGSTPDDE